MKRVKPKNAETKKSTNTSRIKNVSTQTMNFDMYTEVTKLQEQVKLLQLENDVLKQHVSISTKSVNIKVTTCGCKGNCASKRCSCVKKNNKCTASCECNSEVCQNQKLEDQRQEIDQKDKENIFLNGMNTPKKPEELTQNKDVMTTKNILASDKIANDKIDQFNPMKPRHQLSRTPPTKNTIKLEDKNHIDKNTQQSKLSRSPQILVASFNIKRNHEDVEDKVDWEQHVAQLVPCKKCNRSFMPNRIQKHEACCKKI
ncbi:uncharacterized protein LOC105188245 [Harpegnathos saltator]|uniref:uncharacterized protein LOC105188245 n=1 Tax=Harpegnathos saltator TaxID=610380 RepID=UPI00058C0899|nr:uncharacterized protein LOC105188245 [Harpegnathos saltator]XP_011147904.1 uncharacterized protein LOC105188245 [Harpegnathos saltator]XP_019699184.1 uncharacterized protein LOC105188245 [Harpegnathos saltator]